MRRVLVTGVTGQDGSYLAEALIAGGDEVHARHREVRRDDLLTIQADGSKGSAVAGLRKCFIQPLAATPRPVWNPDVDNPIDFRAGWSEVPSHGEHANAFKAQWELFLRHVAAGTPFPWDLLEGAKGVQLAELGLESWRRRTWLDVPPLA